MLNQLIKLGFSKTEAQIYLILLKEKEATPGFIIEKIGIHRMTVYETLRELVKREIIGQSRKNSKMVFKVLNPQKIVEQVKDKYVLAKSLAGELQREYEKLKEKQIVQIFEGKDMLKKTREDAVNSLKRGECFYVLGSGGEEFYSAVGEEFKKAEQKRVKLGIKRKFLVYEPEKYIVEKYEKDNPLSQAKFLPEEFKSPTATIMGRDRINIQILGGQEIIIIIIVNQKITNAYRKYFDVLWKIAK